jgi:hypothetical protein
MIRNRYPWVQEIGLVRRQRREIGESGVDPQRLSQLSAMRARRLPAAPKSLPALARPPLSAVAHAEIERRSQESRRDLSGSPRWPATRFAKTSNASFARRHRSSTMSAIFGRAPIKRR